MVFTLNSPTSILGKTHVRSVSAPCLLLLNSTASYSLNLYGHNTGHQRLQTHANMAIGLYILKPLVGDVSGDRYACHFQRWPHVI